MFEATPVWIIALVVLGVLSGSAHAVVVYSLGAKRLSGRWGLVMPIVVLVVFLVPLGVVWSYMSLEMRVAVSLYLGGFSLPSVGALVAAWIKGHCGFKN